MTTVNVMVHNILKTGESKTGDIGVGEHMLSMLKALGVAPSARKNENKQLPLPPKKLKLNLERMVREAYWSTEGNE